MISSEIPLDQYGMDDTKVYEILRRKRAFWNSASHPLVTDDESDKRSSFRPLPDVLPKTLLEQQEHYSYQKDSSEKSELLSNCSTLTTRKLNYDKPILIIYNPNSGKKTNLQPKIKQRLDEAQLKYEFLGTRKAGDSYHFPKEQVELQKYSLLVAAGGDGTYHEVINGMLARKDGCKLPVALIPNGSGNDLCTSLGIFCLEDALDYIVNGEVFSMDTTQVLLDYDQKEDVPPEKIMTHCRHMLINSTLAMTAIIANEAIKYKKYFGKASYQIAIVQLLLQNNFHPFIYQIEIDGTIVSSPNRTNNVSSILLMLNNGKYTGAGLVINPYACVNDGLTDLTWIEDEKSQKLKGVAATMEKAKKGGLQAYDNTSLYYRGKELKITFQQESRKQKSKKQKSKLQNLGIDGEDFLFKKTVLYSTCPQNVEVVFYPKKYYALFHRGNSDSSGAAKKTNRTT
jgi:diacylglycerol kinase family enzyme